MDCSAADRSRTYVQTTGYDVTIAALHNTRVGRIGIGFGCVVVVCALLSSCVSQKAPDLGDRAPAFETKSLEGEPLAFRPVSGSVCILYFWADWCPRCEEDFRLMDKLYQQWKTQAAPPRFLAVDVGQTEEHVRNFAQRMKISFPIYMDHDGKVARSFGVKGLPTYFLVDGKGVIRSVILGWTDEKTLLAEIAKIQ